MQFILFLIMSIAYADILILAPELKQNKIPRAANSLLYEDWVREQHPSVQNRERLKRLLEHTEKLWASGQGAETIMSLQNVTDLALQDDWTSAEKLMIHQSFCRLASLLDSTSALDVSRRALAFAPQLPVCENKIDADIKNQLETQSIDWKISSEIKNNFSAIILDSDYLNLESLTHLRVAPGLHRVHFISSSHKDVVMMIHAENLPQLQVPKEALIVGDCKSPRWNTLPLAVAEPVKWYYDSDCSRTFKNASWDVTTTPLQLPKPINVTESKERWSFIKKPWFWVGVGIVAAGAVVLMKSNQRTTSEPQVVPTHN